MSAARILFVCTGNIFRSLTAEYSVRHLTPAGSSLFVSSAGLVADPQEMRETLYNTLLAKGVDPAGHIQRRIDQDIIAAHDLVIAMGEDHQQELMEKFGVKAPLFLEVCCGKAQPVLDIHEVLPDWERDPEGTRRYVADTVNFIFENAAHFVENYPGFI